MSPRAPLLVVPSACVLVLLGVSTPAAVEAFERTQSCGSYGTSPCDPGETPKPISWPKRCVKYHVNEKGTSDFPRENGRIGPQLQRLVQQSFEEWNKPDCSDFKMVFGGLTETSSAEYNKQRDADNVNLIVWRDDRWPYSSRTTFALTSVTFTRAGNIRDADIEFNSDVYDFTDVEKGRAPSTLEKVDLRNTLTHEIGHFLGLDHPDDVDATMYSEANTGETKKRTLHQDDIDGLCTIYPAKSPPETCDDPSDFDSPPVQQRKRETTDCSTTPDSPPTPWLAAGLIAVLVSIGRRRRERWTGGI